MNIEDSIKLYDKNRNLFFKRLTKDGLIELRNYDGNIDKNKLIKMTNECVSYMYLKKMMDMFIIRDRVFPEEYKKYKEDIYKYPTLLVSSKYCDLLKLKVRDIVALMNSDVVINIRDLRNTYKLFEAVEKLSLDNLSVDEMVFEIDTMFNHDSVYLKSLLILNIIKPEDQSELYNEIVCRYYYNNISPSGVVYNVLINNHDYKDLLEASKVNNVRIPDFVYHGYLNEVEVKKIESFIEQYNSRNIKKVKKL